jgi:enoyl-CoA hydratase/carnithine racemase
MTQSILLTREGAVATLLLNRPERMNAFDLDMWRRLGEIMDQVSEDDGLRCVILRGAGGRAFAAGADIAEFTKVRANAAQAAVYGKVVEAAVEAVRDCRHPTLAVIEGACMGGGLELALECDLRLSNASARFGIPIKRLGHCLPYPAMVTLIELAGRATAMELLLEGRILGAEEALAKGLVTRVVADTALETEAAATAKRIAEGAPLAARSHKAFARRALDPRPFSEAEWLEPLAVCDTADYREGVRAFLAKEKPVFKGE